MTDVAIVGAGPAGMAAAVAVADAGFSVLVVDEQARAGGQIFRRPPAEWGQRHGRYKPYTWAKDLIERFEDHPGIQTAFRSTAFGVLRDRTNGMGLQLAIHTPEGGRLVPARRLLIATGAHDMPVAFPGWTLPGVMTAGAVQSLLKSQKLLMGQRLVLAGSHPILLILAEQLLDAGAEIAEIALARGLPKMTEMIAAVPAIPGHVALFADAARALGKIVARGVPLSHKTIIDGVEGDAAVTGVRLAKVDDDWARTGAVRGVQADLLVIGYGFNPSTELARQAGCKMRWEPALSGWIVAHDAAFETSAEGVFVAGEPTGVAGAERSWAEGQMAGLSIAASLGAVFAPAQRRQLDRILARAHRFSRVMQAMFEPKREALADLSCPKEVIICRCELVTSGRLEVVLAQNPFISSANAVKLECRSGMGPCQGRYCEGTVAARIAKTRNATIKESGFFYANFPIKPTVLQAFCDLAEETNGLLAGAALSSMAHSQPVAFIKPARNFGNQGIVEPPSVTDRLMK